MRFACTWTCLLTLLETDVFHVRIEEAERCVSDELVLRPQERGDCLPRVLRVDDDLECDERRVIEEFFERKQSSVLSVVLHLWLTQNFEGRCYAGREDVRHSLTA